jgi:hypothetical protein
MSLPLISTALLDTLGTPIEKQRHKAKAAGEPVRRAREERADCGERSPEEVRKLRQEAAQSATLCADCFEPLPRGASVTMTGRKIFCPAVPAGGGLPGFPAEWCHLHVPICVTCWLIGIEREARERVERPFFRKEYRCDRHVHEAAGVRGLRRLRCLGCRRPMRLHVGSKLHLKDQVCCADCDRMRIKRRDSERRRVRHDEITCEVCGDLFTQARSDAKTCSNRCRQRLHRRRDG